MYQLVRRGTSYLAIPLGIAFVAAGYWFASKLIQIPNLQVFKVLNIIALACDFAGIAILSQFVMTSAKAKSLVVEHLTPQIANLFAGFPTGMVAASIVGSDGPSQMLVRDFSILFQFTLVWPCLYYAVFLSKKKKISAAVREHRVNVTGTFFLAYGVAVQFIAALQDLYAK